MGRFVHIRNEFRNCVENNFAYITKILVTAVESPGGVDVIESGCSDHCQQGDRSLVFVGQDRFKVLVEFLAVVDIGQRIGIYKAFQTVVIFLKFCYAGVIVGI